ncbi:prepilin-type N-terminal cleavage/methylation domain-containing protein [bacterium]|nr:prepilin-type N-terminal cleavage/methylation domain-containing protein [bacterium]
MQRRGTSGAPGLIRSIRQRAFTLIELLIVVAIIAILAAIALPNFLEAQVRAKVSRVKNDLRTLTVGVESYRLDHNRYLPHNDSPLDMTPLTTPIAYLGHLPQDPFNSSYNSTYHLIGDTYTWQDLEDIFRVKNPAWGGGTWLRDQVNGGRYYSLSSPGPDRQETMASDAAALYDPTNGTMSMGDIYRLGP